MWLILQQDEPDDFVIATGVSHSITQFLDEACRQTKANPKIKINEKYNRPADIFDLRGDATKAHEVLGWEPKLKFKGLVKKMLGDEE